MEKCDWVCVQVEGLQVLFLDLQSAIGKVTRFLEKRRAERKNNAGQSSAPRESGHKRWTNVFSTLVTSRKQNMEEISNFCNALHDSVNGLLILLISLYHAPPEVPESSPKIYSLLGAPYSRHRSILRVRRILPRSYISSSTCEASCFPGPYCMQ